MMHIIKIMLVGDDGVGKRTLQKKYLGSGFKDGNINTAGMDYSILSKHFDEYDLKLNFWRLSPFDRFATIRSGAYSNAHASLVVFDVTKRETFMSINKWLDELLMYSKKPDIPVVILGNNMDTEVDPVVKKGDVDYLINELKSKPKFSELNISYFEISIETGLNIDNVVDKLTQEAIRILEK